jgi:hypothetical protein
MEPDVCLECGFEWGQAIETAIETVGGAVELFASIVSQSATRSSDPGNWSAIGYLWHVVDVLRLGTERLWAIELEPGSTVPGWDQELLSIARHYEELSTTVGLKALDRAAQDWLTAASAVDPAGYVMHASLGEVSGRYSILRNAHEVVHHARDAVNSSA